MGSKSSKITEAKDEKRENNLETYLNEVYEKQCLFDIHENEVDFIQIGIEALVQKIVDWILRNLQDKFSVLESQSSIIRVGSFYEGTKNKYPDEFDFIFIYDSCTESSYTKLGHRKIYEDIEKLFDLKKAKLTLTFRRGNRQLYFNKRIMRHGPAEMLEFIYKSESSDVTKVHVDLVPAVRVLDESIEEIISKNCSITLFRAEVLSVGKCLFINAEYSFTEAVVYFMENKLSENHRKVYRVLKYLINGHEDSKTLEYYFSAFTFIYGKGYTSYMIKTMMILHHYSCKLSESSEVSPCLLQVLQDMSTFTNKSDFPRIVISDEFYRKKKTRLVLRDRLQLMLNDLKSLQDREECVRVEKIGIKGSLTRQYIDSKWSVKLTKDKMNKFSQRAEHHSPQD